MWSARWYRPRALRELWGRVRARLPTLAYALRSRRGRLSGLQRSVRVPLHLLNVHSCGVARGPTIRKSEPASPASRSSTLDTSQIEFRNVSMTLRTLPVGMSACRTEFVGASPQTHGMF